MHTRYATPHATMAAISQTHQNGPKDAHPADAPRMHAAAMPLHVVQHAAHCQLASGSLSCPGTLVSPPETGIPRIGSPRPVGGAPRHESAARSAFARRVENA